MGIHPETTVQIERENQFVLNMSAFMHGDFTGIDASMLPDVVM